MKINMDTGAQKVENKHSLWNSRIYWGILGSGGVGTFSYLLTFSYSCLAELINIALSYQGIIKHCKAMRLEEKLTKNNLQTNMTAPASRTWTTERGRVYAHRDAFLKTSSFTLPGCFLGFYAFGILIWPNNNISSSPRFSWNSRRVPFPFPKSYLLGF